MAFSRIGVRHPQRGDGNPAEPHGGVEHRSELDAAESESGRGPRAPGPHRDHNRVGPLDMPRDHEGAVQRHRFVVPTERLPARDRRVEQ